MGNQTTATCPACNGVVAYGIKQCPHCGKPKPAPEPPKAVTRNQVVGALAGLVLVIGFLAQDSTNKLPAGNSTDFKTQAATLINANGHLCAGVVSAFKPREDQLEVVCNLYRQGSDERRAYSVNVVSGKVVVK